jgi:hypothetical protein
LAVLVAAALVSLVIACGVERWSVKVGTDADAGQIDPTNPVWTSVSEFLGVWGDVSPRGYKRKRRIVLLFALATGFVRPAEELVLQLPRLEM